MGLQAKKQVWHPQDKFHQRSTQGLQEDHNQ